MAVNISIYDLDFPDSPKTVTVDLKTIVPLGTHGDEKWVLSFVTTAYSDNANTTAIQDIYIQETRSGWLKSSGMVGNAGKFTISGSNKQIGIKLDNSTGVASGNGYYVISLNEGVNLTGEAIAENIEEQIRALPDDASWNSNDDGFKLAYLAASVKYTNGRFWIVSGSVSPFYTGTNRSSVKVYKISGDTCYETLGFNLSTDSETIAGVSINEVLLSSDYIGGNTDMHVNTGLGITVNDSLAITDGVSTDFFTAISGSTETILKLATVGTHNYDAISPGTTYSGGVSKVQKLRLQDPENMPVSYYTTIDDVVRQGIMSLANQVDFS